MSRKQQINRFRHLIKVRKAIELELELPGEPLIYSIKYPVGKKRLGLNVFRNKKWASMIRCYFRSQIRTNAPVVVIVRFYVTPPENIKVSAKDLRSELVPALPGFEICDYLLSFHEILYNVLITTYRQIVKVDASKFYSNRPRTVFQFMTWEQYVYLKNYDSVHAKTKGVSPTKEKKCIQS